MTDGVSVRRIGRGSPNRVLLHGFGANSGTFQNLIGHLRGAGTLFLVDLPGHGGSRVPDEDPTPEGLASAIMNGLADRLDGPFEIVGHSLGALIGTHIAHLDPTRVERLHLISCAGVGHDYNRAFFERFISATTPEALAAVLQVAYAGSPAGLGIAARSILKWLDQPGVRRYARKVVGGLEEFRPAFESTFARGIPLSMLWGGEDRITPLGNTRTLSPEIALSVAAGAGHIPHVEVPEFVARWLLSPTA